MRSRRIARAAVLLAILGVVAAIYLSPLREHMNREEIREIVAQLRGYWYGPLVFIVLFAIGCVFAIPASLFVVSAGLIWGWVWGGTYSIIGGVIGAVISFFAGRFIGEGLLDRFGRVGRVVKKQVDHAGFKSLLVLRFIPGLPFAALNYGAGVCGVTLGDFVFATLLGMAPSVYVFAYCADALLNGTMSEGDALKRLLILGALLISITLLPQLVKRMFRPQVPGPGPQSESGFPGPEA